jgi:peptidoglycan hydrolase-like protein with peptidoglycan-binding domain
MKKFFLGLVAIAAMTNVSAASAQPYYDPMQQGNGYAMTPQQLWQQQQQMQQQQLLQQQLRAQQAQQAYGAAQYPQQAQYPQAQYQPQYLPPQNTQAPNTAIYYDRSMTPPAQRPPTVQSNPLQPNRSRVTAPSFNATTDGTAFAPGLAQPMTADIQRSLNEHGYDAGQPTGTVTAKTRSAILAYQKDAGMRQDGIASPLLIDNLHFAIPKTYASRSVTNAASSSAKPRSADPKVLIVQNDLKTLGFYDGSADGHDGKTTQAALSKFQASIHARIDSRINDQLVATLTQAVAAKTAVAADAPKAPVVETPAGATTPTEKPATVAAPPESPAAELTPAKDAPTATPTADLKTGEVINPLAPKTNTAALGAGEIGLAKTVAPANAKADF